MVEGAIESCFAIQSSIGEQQTFMASGLLV